jgi:PAS domain S-box-containing protein
MLRTHLLRADASSPTKLSVQDAMELQAELEKMRAEADVLRVAQADTRRSSERYRAIFESSSEAQLLVDERGIFDCNQATVKMLRCRDKAEVLALHPAVLSPEFQPDGRRSRDKAVENDRAAREHGSHRFSWVHRRQNGEDFPVQVSICRVVLDSGPVMLVTWYDLSELQKHESALRAQAELLARQEQTIRRLVSPVLTVGEGVLLVPILGALDARRGADMIESVLGTLDRQHGHAVILDLTGVENFDAATAGHIVRLCAAVGLLGARAVLAGIGPAVARTIVELDATALARAEIVATAGEAIARALRR